MARSRNIKPAFFLNTDLSEIEPLARLTFIGLWTLADYKGCLECNLKKIKAQILPYDECDFELVVNNLSKYRFIRYYVIQEKKYIKIVNFEKHQNPHKNERDAGSDIPDITENDSKIIGMYQDGTKTDFIGSARADSLLLIPDSLNLIAEGENQKPHSTTTFSMNPEWEPSESFDSLCVSAGIRIDENNLPVDELQEFRTYWLTKPEKKRTQSEWEFAFIKNLKSIKLRAVK
jgi:hypothetical protein